MPANPRAIFLSYASQDADVAKSIASVLRAAKIVVWLDQSELRGGDVWDARIQRQVATCTLFLPIISAHTQGRREGYFRLEWRMADERVRRMALDTPFLVPVAVDDIVERNALVPRSFLDVHWSRLTRGSEIGADFVGHVQGLLAQGTLRGETLLHVFRPAHTLSPAPGDRSIVMPLRPSASREPTGATLAHGSVAPPTAVSFGAFAAPVSSSDSKERPWFQRRRVLLGAPVIATIAAIWMMLQRGSFP